MHDGPVGDEGHRKARRRLFEMPAPSRLPANRSSRSSADGPTASAWDDVDTFVVRDPSSPGHDGSGLLPDLWDASGILLGKLEHVRESGLPRLRLTPAGLKLGLSPSRDDVRLRVVLRDRSSGAVELTIQRIVRASEVGVHVTSHIPGRASGAVTTTEARLEVRSSHGDVVATGRPVGVLSWEVTPSPRSSSSSPVAAMIESHPTWLPGLGGGRGWSVTITPSGRALTHLVVGYALMAPLL